MSGRTKFFSKRKIICFHLEEEEKERLIKAAKELGMEMSSYLRWLIKKELKKMEKEGGNDD